MDIFGFIGSIFGHLLWFLFSIFQNFGIAILVFTIILKIIMYPFTIKQQKTMAGQARLQKKQKELQAKFANNKAKYNEELQKLYAKEGFNPASGCLNSIFPMLIMLGIYQAVINPLRNTLHIATDKVNLAVEHVKALLGNTAYPELEIVRNFDTYKDSLTMFSSADVDKIESFSDGFLFAGLDLLKFPSEAGFLEFLWIIPVLSLVSSWFMSFYMSKSSGVQQPGCMKATMYIMPLLSAYWAYIFPASVGLYWVYSNVLSAVQYFITNKFFSPTHMTARDEASRFVSLELQEDEYKPLPLSMQQQIADKIEEKKKYAALNQSTSKDQNNDKNTKNKKSSKTNKSNNNYLGNK